MNEGRNQDSQTLIVANRKGLGADNWKKKKKERKTRVGARVVSTAPTANGDAGGVDRQTRTGKGKIKGKNKNSSILGVFDHRRLRATRGGGSRVDG